MSSSSQSRLEKLQAKRAQIDHQIKDAQARESAQKRKEDTRRKIIAGALALHHMENNPASDFAKKMTRLLDEYVTKPHERKLMGLSPSSNDNSGELSNTFHEQSSPHRQG